MTSLDHIRYLAESIGPRGSTTDEESKAADYVADQLVSIGLSPERQSFQSGVSAYVPYVLFAIVMILGVFLFLQPQPVGAAAAAILTATGLISVILELRLKSNPLRWLLPIEGSHNVYATIPGADAGIAEDTPGAAKSSQARQTVVVVAHLDTHRTPLIFSSHGWLRVARWLPAVGIAGGGLLFVLAIIGIAVPEPILRQIALIPGVLMLFILALMLQADRTSFANGADDNAGGVGLLLALAERLKQSPLLNTDVIALFTGCAEVGGYGAEAFIRDQDEKLGDPIWVVVSRVGATGTKPCIVRGEQLLDSVASDADLVVLADDIAPKHPELDIIKVPTSLAHSELSIGAKYDLRVVAIGSRLADGTSPQWHRRGDVIASVDGLVVDHTEELAWLFLCAVDASIAEPGVVGESPSAQDITGSAGS